MNIIIIGAGPAGLIAAETLSQNGANVGIYDQKPSVARKFLMAGRGGLNLTHSENFEKFITRYGAAEKFLTPALRAFTPDDMREWCEGLGQETFVGSSGRVFPTTMKASPLLRAWLLRLTQNKVVFHSSHIWRGWDDDGAIIFETAESIKKVPKPDAVILALGGGSWPSLGSDGSWVEILRAKGVNVKTLSPSNCGFICGWSEPMKKFAGTPLKTIALTHNDTRVMGEMMIAQNGVEGGAVYALSAAIRDDIAKNGAAKIMIDLRPGMDIPALIEKLSRPRGRQSFSTYLKNVLSLPPVAITFLREGFPDIAAQPIETLAHAVKNIPLSLTAPFSIDRAISSGGGIMLDEITDDYKIKKLDKVYVCGEMLDWESPTGGYLLQACFATGMAAAKGILKTR